MQDTLTPERLKTTEQLEGAFSYGEFYADQPTAVDVAAMPGDFECIEKAEANLTARHIGDIALGGSVELKQKPIRNVKEGLDWAVSGDKDGIEMLDKNIAKEMSEYKYKAGNISKVNLETDSLGRILQNGQLMDDVYRNGYQMASEHPVLKARSQAEAHNGARIENLNQEGVLDTHSFVVFSRTEESLSDQELDDLHFFSATKSVSIQATTNGPEGLTTETAFVAGLSKDGERRTDREVVEALAEYFGVDMRGKTVAEQIDTPLLIPNQFIKNGVIDIVKLYDDINGGTFFGQDVERQDYKEFKEFCEKRESEFDLDKKKIRGQLVSESHTLDSAVEVSKRLAKLVEERLVKQAIEDDAIDVRVFGAESAENILTARLHVANGDHKLALTHIQTAINTARGGSCPSSLESLAKLLGNPDSEQAEREKLSWHGGETKSGTCVNCEKKTIVGVANWCKSCIKC